MRIHRPSLILHPTRWFLILLNCAKLKFVSRTSSLLERTCDFPNHTMFLQKWILNPQDLLQNRSLETVSISIVLHCFPHDNVVCIHLCDEYMKSTDITVCHMLRSIWWLIVQVDSLTIEYWVFQYVPGFSISEQFKSHTFVNSLTDFNSSSWKSSGHGIDTL